MNITINSKFHLDTGSLYTFINPFSFREICNSKDRDSIFNNFIIHPDGISICMILSLLGRKVERTSFDDTSIAPNIFRQAAQEKFTLGLIGSTKVVISGAQKILESTYNIKNIVSNSGYFSDGEKPEILSKYLKCDIVICSMGTPRQEIILLELRKMGWQGTGFTCGGYFDQLVSSDGKNYYPYIIDKLNLRWAYRIFREPKRLWRRYLLDYPLGVIKLTASIKRLNIRKI